MAPLWVWEGLCVSPLKWPAGGSFQLRAVREGFALKPNSALAKAPHWGQKLVPPPLQQPENQLHYVPAKRVPAGIKKIRDVIA